MNKPEFSTHDFALKTGRKVKKSVFRFLFSRLTITAVLLCLQFYAIIYALLFLRGRWVIAYQCLKIVSPIVLIWLVRKSDNPSYKIPWIIIILFFAPFGALFYLFMGNTPLNRARLVRVKPIRTDVIEQFRVSDTRTLCKTIPQHRRTCEYLYDIVEMPAWKNTAAEYFPLGDYLYDSMLRRHAGGAAEGGALYFHRVFHHRARHHVGFHLGGSAAKGRRGRRNPLDV